MSLVALDGTPLVIVGAAGREGGIVLPSFSSLPADATNEATIMIGQIFTEDASSHTIDTTGSSSIGWRTGAVTFANAGTTYKVGIAPVDTATGPPGRATNVADVITFDVSRSMTGGGGDVTANAWQEHAPTAGTKTIAHGDVVAVAMQMTARAGADSIVVQASGASATSTLPSVTGWVGSYVGVSAVPNAVITFSDGKLGFFFGGFVATTTSTTQTWNSGSATKEYGNYLLMPVPAKIYGIAGNVNLNGDTDLVLYSDPLGTPVAQKTVSIDFNTVGGAAVNTWHVGLFSSPYSSTALQPLAAIVKPTSVTNIGAPYKTFNAATHQKAETLGANGYAINRAAGAFAAQNSNKDRFAVGLLVGAFEHGVSPTYLMGI